MSTFIELVATARGSAMFKARVVSFSLFSPSCSTAANKTRLPLIYSSVVTRDPSLQFLDDL
jgi:hypothetical protein